MTLMIMISLTDKYYILYNYDNCDDRDNSNGNKHNNTRTYNNTDKNTNDDHATRIYPKSTGMLHNIHIHVYIYVHMYVTVCTSIVSKVCTYII